MRSAGERVKGVQMSTMLAPTDAQMSFLRSLTERMADRAYADRLLASAADRAGASRAIDAAKVAPKGAIAPKGAAAPEALAIGFYGDGVDIYRVIPTRDGSRTYATVLVDISRAGRPEWGYRPGLMALARKAKRMTLAEAGLFGITHGYCLCCARLLTDPESVEIGVGPICRKNYF
jgi:hypothetical protein